MMNIWSHIDCQGMSSTMHGIYNKSLSKSIAWEYMLCGMLNFSMLLFDTTPSLEEFHQGSCLFKSQWLLGSNYGACLNRSFQH